MIAVPQSIHTTAYTTLPLDACDISLLNKNSCASNYTMNEATSTSRSFFIVSENYVPQQDQYTRGCLHSVSP